MFYELTLASAVCYMTNSFVGNGISMGILVVGPLITLGRVGWKDHVQEIK